MLAAQHTLAMRPCGALKRPQPLLMGRARPLVPAVLCRGTPSPRSPPPRSAPAPVPTHHHRKPRAPAALKRSNSGTFDPLKEFQRELGMQSNRLNPETRERVEAAIEALGYRATVGDVAARAGVKISEADEALKALAYDALGHLEVRAGGWGRAGKGGTAVESRPVSIAPVLTPR